MLAKQLVNLRKQKTKNMAVSSRITAIGHQAQTMHSTAKMAGAMSTASKVLYGMFVCLGHVWVMLVQNWSMPKWYFPTYCGLPDPFIIIIIIMLTSRNNIGLWELFRLFFDQININ